MEDALLVSRLQFAFTVTYHYLFPMFTMGLALLVFVLKTIYMRTGNDLYNESARFWGRIFAISFVMGVVTGIPLEFQFGTNWAAFSAFTGDIIAQTLAMEGAFAFFLESAFVGLFLFGERRFGQRVHWFSSLMVFLGTWGSGYFIITTNAWMQNPVGYRVLENGNIELNDYWAVLLNPWMVWQFLHNMGGAVVCAAFVMAGLGAFYLLSERDHGYARIFLKVGVVSGVLASLWMLFPTGHFHSEMVAEEQPATLAAMEGLFETEQPAGIVILGQPDVENRTIDNPLVVPRALSFLIYQNWNAEVKGLEAFPEENWPDNIPLLYYSYHVMVGLGTIFIAVMVLAAFLLWRGRLYGSRWMLWILMLAIPFPFIANTAGWLTAELGRQPWLAYGLFRTEEGVSPLISSGSVLFTLIGFAGMYLIMGLLYIVLMVREVSHGPQAEGEPQEEPGGVTA
ncbi:Cytochrome bd-I ubiquinol oxidase subunit 1 [Rubrobacter xylanophilus DSM 9941]|uniref:cytochrome ubiquinol oxidase subunit I n=1 Tax=Rubrobacter xylanophilus TaxID=49319 RepID=UPI001C643A77|nr:cytochrome ubiquinol oxidase subunit I [Rubrobacter xylanophilus]QYJ15457.1 Cytochrome bd-I ubiquinol oxidase subunit 1 [Rubrobacter xylanophilus DSM 9941]